MSGVDECRVRVLGHQRSNLLQERITHGSEAYGPLEEVVSWCRVTATGRNRLQSVEADRQGKCPAQACFASLAEFTLI